MAVSPKASSKEAASTHPQAKASVFATKAVTEVLTKNIIEVLEELPLDPMVSKVEPQREGTMVCHQDQLKNESCRRNKAMIRHCYLEQIGLPNSWLFRDA